MSTADDLAADFQLLHVPAPLTTDNLTHHDRQLKATASALTTIERRQFVCPKHGPFWKQVVAAKPVARCKSCNREEAEADPKSQGGPKYTAIPKEEERGRGSSAARAAATRGRRTRRAAACISTARMNTATPPSGRSARFQRKFASRCRRARTSGSGARWTPSRRMASPRAVISAAATGACKRKPPESTIHESTGSTAPTLSVKTWTTNGSVAWSEGSSQSRRSRGGRGSGTTGADSLARVSGSRSGDSPARSSGSSYVMVE